MGSNKPGMGKDMLLAIDIGNTNFTVGVFKERELLATFRITTKLQRTSDEYGIVFIELIRTRGLSPADIEDVIISSVVPNVMHSVVNAMKKYFNRQPILVGPGIKTESVCHVIIRGRLDRTELLMRWGLMSCTEDLL